jgi:hypothetical protein
MAAHLTHEGEPRFVVYHCDFNDDPCQRVAEYENVADVLTRRPHFDQHLKVRMGSEYFEWPDFAEWARVQKSAVHHGPIATGHPTSHN